MYIYIYVDLYFNETTPTHTCEDCEMCFLVHVNLVENQDRLKTRFWQLFHAFIKQVT